MTQNHDIPTTPSLEPTGLPFLFRAFGSRNYRLFFSGQLISLVGTWLTNTAITWLVYRLTNKPFVLGLVTFAGQIPAFVLSPFAGVMVDRWRLRRVLVWTQILSMLESFGLALLAFVAVGLNHTLSPHAIVIVIVLLLTLAAFQGLVNAFDIPARQSFVIQLVEKRSDLPNAIALNSSMFNAARLLGPAVAGYLIYSVGEAWCFALDGLSYIAVIFALLAMRLPPRTGTRINRRVLIEFKEGLRYAWGFRPIRSILLLLAGLSLCGTPQVVLMPVFAKNILHGDARTQGWLMASIAAGALAGALRLAGRRTVLGLGRSMPLAAAGMGGMLMVFGFSHVLWLSMAALVGVGFCMMTQVASGNTLLQTIVEDEKRGRVMSLFAMAVMGMMPLGALLTGTLASVPALGPQWTTAICGTACMVAAAIFTTQLPAIRREVRPIYIQRGILPQVAEALEAADAAVAERRQ